MDKVKISIDNVEREVEEGKTILEVALEEGIYIPHLCHHADLKPAGICRLWWRGRARGGSAGRVAGG